MECQLGKTSIQWRSHHIPAPPYNDQFKFLKTLKMRNNMCEICLHKNAADQVVDASNCSLCIR
jgi:hypothetical protein